MDFAARIPHIFISHNGVHYLQDKIPIVMCDFSFHVLQFILVVYIRRFWEIDPVVKKGYFRASCYFNPIWISLCFGYPFPLVLGHAFPKREHLMSIFLEKLNIIHWACKHCE